MQHLVVPAGALDGLMSICLSVPAVQVGGYSAQQVEIGRHTATPPASCCRASFSAAPPSRICRQITGISAASVWVPYCGCVLRSQLVSKFLGFSLVILSPPLSTGILGICLFANLEQPQSWPNVRSQTPKNIRELMRWDATRACRHWLVIWYATVVISEIIDFEHSPCIFLLYTQWTIFHTCVRRCAHTHTHTFTHPPPSLGAVGSYFGTPCIPGKKITSF